MTTPFFIHVDPSKPFVLKTNTFNFVIGIVFFQVGENNPLRLVDFYSRKFFRTKINYEIHDKKLLAIMGGFEEWHHLLEGAQHEIIMFPDHKNLQYFMTTCVLNQRQAQWALSLFQF
jgi:hypothetical protein